MVFLLAQYLFEGFFPKHFHPNRAFCSFIFLRRYFSGPLLFNSFWPSFVGCVFFLFLLCFLWASKLACVCLYSVRPTGKNSPLSRVCLFDSCAASSPLVSLHFSSLPPTSYLLFSISFFLLPLYSRRKPRGMALCSSPFVSFFFSPFFFYCCIFQLHSPLYFAVYAVHSPSPPFQVVTARTYIFYTD